MWLPPAVPSLPQPTPIPLRPPTASSRPPRLAMQWRHPTLRLQSRRRGLWSLPPMLPIRTTRPPLSMPTGSLSPRLPLSLPPPRRRTRCTRTRSVFFCFFDVFCLFLFTCCDIESTDFMSYILTCYTVICLNTAVIRPKYIYAYQQDNYSYGRPAAVTTFDNKQFYQTSIASAQRTPTETYYQTGESFKKKKKKIELWELN